MMQWLPLGEGRINLCNKIKELLLTEITKSSKIVAYYYYLVVSIIFLPSGELIYCMNNLTSGLSLSLSLYT